MDFCTEKQGSTVLVEQLRSGPMALRKVPLESGPFTLSWEGLQAPTRNKTNGCWGTQESSLVPWYAFWGCWRLL